jgi:hypothetical protein
MTDGPPVQIGQFRRVKVWALYFIPEPAEDTNLVDQVVPQPAAAVVWFLSDDECHCGRCTPFVNERSCPELEAVARSQHRREQERRPDQVIELDTFEMPAYLTTGGRIREIVAQVTERRNASDG